MGVSHLISWRSQEKTLRSLRELGFLPGSQLPWHSGLQCQFFPGFPICWVGLIGFHSHMRQFFKSCLSVFFSVSICLCLYFLSLSLSLPVSVSICLSISLQAFTNPWQTGGFCFLGEYWERNLRMRGKAWPRMMIIQMAWSTDSLGRRMELSKMMLLRRKWIANWCDLLWRANFTSKIDSQWILSGINESTMCYWCIQTI